MPHIDAIPTYGVFADTNRWVKVASYLQYGSGCGRLLGMKMADRPGWVGQAAAVQDLAEANLSGLRVLGYQFSPMDVDIFLKVFPPSAQNIPCLDFELYGRWEAQGAREARIWVKAAELWVRVVEREWGRYPVFYGRSLWKLAGEPVDTIISQCPAWVPQYGPTLDVPRGLGRVVAWQYTDGKHGPEGWPQTAVGMGGKPCDMSVLLVPVREWWSDGKEQLSKGCRP